MPVEWLTSAIDSVATGIDADYFMVKSVLAILLGSASLVVNSNGCASPEPWPSSQK